MKASRYIAEYLRNLGVTDVFGIPGGVILDLIYAFDATEGIVPHLCYHEQSAGFAACGYAQAGGRLGVAYATQGPGFTNLLTAMADAYYDSTPVLFLTAHSVATLPEGNRLVADQEMDTCSIVRGMTKYARRIDDAAEVVDGLSEASRIAMEGRKGPVFLDIASSLLTKEVAQPDIIPQEKQEEDVSEWVDMIAGEIRKASRPVVLVGDGINQTLTAGAMNAFAKKAGVPVISSRFGHNIISDPTLYYGYVGSHGVRYANFILSKADLVVSLGNRLNFPPASRSYSRIVEQAGFLRVDIDPWELEKHPRMQKGIRADLTTLLPALAVAEKDYGHHKEWMQTCNLLRKELVLADVDETVERLGSLLQSVPKDTVLVSDVGNNEFWLSRACVYARKTNRTLYSKSFGALGNALGKAIGAFYAERKPVIVFAGDQGLQMNIQELQYISQHRLPITVVVLNNASSGMIKDREAMAGYPYSLHTTEQSGYAAPAFAQIAKAYGIEYRKVDPAMSLKETDEPLLAEMEIPESLSLTPFLPKGRDIQDMEPRIPQDIYDHLNNM